MMFLVDDQTNSMSEIAKSTFAQLHYKEREHLQEWIAKNPRCLCSRESDKLLIIQKEFDGFEGTKERLDLLALDQAGALVVIENKLDNTGKDVTWQALKYVSYCSTLKSQQIIDIYQQYLDRYFFGEDAVKNLISFYNGVSLEEVSLNSEDQRMILVAADFRSEVTSTVMWMLAHNLRVQCFRAEPYRLNDGSVILDIEQIIPVVEAEDYMIKIAEKDREKDIEHASAKGIESVRRRFWELLLDRYREADSSFDNISPSGDHWLSHGSGVSGCPFSFLATTAYVGVELNIARPSQEENKQMFDMLFSMRDSVEEEFEDALIWDRQDNNKRSRIALEKQGLNIANEDDQDEMIELLCGAMPRLIGALKRPLKNVWQGLLADKNYQP